MSYVNASSIFTVHRGQKGNLGQSPRIWDLLASQMLSPSAGGNPKYDFDDFMRFAEIAPAISGPTSGVSGGYAAFLSTTTTTSSIKQIEDENGAIELLAGATAHHQAVLQAGGTTGATISIPSDMSGEYRCFEARVQVPEGNTSAGQGAFVGLASAGNAASNFMANTTMALKDTNLIGFHFPVGSTNVIRPVFRKLGETVNDTAGVVKTYTPGEWVKIGFHFRRSAQPREAFQFFVDNERVAAFSKSDVEGLFPLDALMSQIVAIKALNSSGAKLQVDFMGVGKS